MAIGAVGAVVVVRRHLLQHEARVSLVTLDHTPALDGPEFAEDVDAPTVDMGCRKKRDQG